MKSVGETVVELMKLSDLSQEEVAKRVRGAGAANVRFQHIQQLINFPGRRPRYLPELAMSFGMSVEEFLAWQPPGTTLDAREARSHLRPVVTWSDPEDLDAHRHVIVPRVMLKFSAGNGGPRWEPDPDPAQGQAFRAAFLKRDGLKVTNLMSAYAVGDSMEMRIQDGDSLLIDTSKTEIRDGNVYAIAWDEELRAKRLFKTPGGGLLISSDNKDKYPPFEIPAERLESIVVIGQVIHISGKI